MTDKTASLVPKVFSAESFCPPNIFSAESDREGVFGEVFNVGTGRSYSVLDLTDMIGGSKRFLDPRPAEAKHTLADVQKSRQLSGWVPSQSMEDYIKKHSQICTECRSLSSSKSSTTEKQIDGTTVTLLYILSFFIPLAGFIVGAIYASKEEEHYKHVGKNCLIFSVLNLILGFIVIVAIIAG